MPIQVLSEALVNKIAAGEVIVRPASVVKELVENSIDAGATRVRIETSNSCRDLKITDNGCGMEREDAKLALIRHATSKITTFDDLWSLQTRGFRGEALASISAVSRLQILTRKPGNVAGTRVTAEGAGEPRIEPAGAPEGTEIRVKDLFFNTPARLKFMKSAAAELQQVLLTVTRQALIRNTIGFSVASEKSVLVEVPPEQDWEERVVALLGSQFTDNLLDISGERNGIVIRGFVARPTVSRRDRTQQFFFVNGRPVSSRTLSYVLQQAFQGLIMTQRFPVCVLEIQLPPGEVDVNVHPTKEEVRFRNESLVNGSLFKTISERLQSANLLPVANLSQQPAFTGAPRQPELLSPLTAVTIQDSTRQMPVDFSHFTSHVSVPTDPAAAFSQMQRAMAGIVQTEREFAVVAQNDEHQSTTAEVEPDSTCSVRPLTTSIQNLPETNTAESSKLIRNGVYPEPLGQIAKCYILAQCGEDLLLIDQHAAHERLLYMQLSDVNRHVQTQPLLIPVSLDIPAAALPMLDNLLPVLEKIGLKLEPFGGQTYVVQTVPADLRNFDAAAVISDLLDEYEALGKIEQIAVLHDRVITRMACRAAIKAGQQLHLDEMRRLIRDIIQSRLGFTCPHGRPTMILLTRDQLDRQFKRKL
jgi:DNA mismatch repair protein MutL